MNLALLLEMVTDAAADRVVVGSRAGGIVAAELQRRARRASALFAGAGAERVGLLDVNSDAVPIALFGAALAGLPFAPVNYRMPDEQLGRVLGRLGPATVVAGPDMVARVPTGQGLDAVTRDEFLASTTTADEPGDDLPFVDPDDVAVLLFTSGTTGEPKTAVLRHRHLASYIIATVEFLGAGDDEAQLVSVPPYHIAGVSTVLSSLYAGRRLVYLPAFDAEEWVRTAAAEAVTHAMVVPTMLGRILDCLETSGTGLPSLRHLSYGGGRMPLEVVERAMQLLPGVDFVNAYGLTETSSTISVLTPDDHRQAVASADPAVRRRLTSVGRPLPTIELEIREPGGGGALGPGARGEICVRGEQVAGEYLERTALTADGWFPTNDAGWLDDDGFLFLDGRLDDVIVRGAENLSPGEIEDVLRSHPAVADVAVVGIPDPEWGEAVAAAVVLAEDGDVSPSDLQQWVRERLRSTRTPELIQFRDELPYSETGKLLRRIVRTELTTSP